MLNFENRQSDHLNRKIFEVEKIEKDESGEIVRFIGTLVRADNPTVEGTPLNANSLSLIVNKYYPLTTIFHLEPYEEGKQSDSLKIVTDEELDVSIQNSCKYFTVTYNNNSEYKEIIITVKLINDIDDSLIFKYDFTVTLTSRKTGIERGTINYTVYIVGVPTEGID